MKFSDIPQLTRSGSYKVNVDWWYLEDTLRHWTEETKTARLDLNPDFQRGHVWTKEQQIAYVEYKFRGGTGSNLILFNCVGWMNSFRGPFVLVDGKQRLEAVRAFLANKIPVFDHFLAEYEDPHKLHGIDFVFQVNDLKTRADVLRWYLEINSAGTPHTIDEINKVKELLEREQ